MLNGKVEISIKEVENLAIDGKTVEKIIKTLTEDGFTVRTTFNEILTCSELSDNSTERPAQRTYLLEVTKT